MDFALSAEEQAFADEVERFLDENHDPEVMDPTKENFAQLVDTPARRVAHNGFRHGRAVNHACPPQEERPT